MLLVQMTSFNIVLIKKKVVLYVTYSGMSTKETPLVPEEVSPQRCPLNRGDNYKECMSVLPAGTRRSVSLIEVSSQWKFP